MFTINNYPLIILLLLSLSFSRLAAQEEEVDRNITIEREFQPVVEDAGKITSLPEILQLSKTKERVVYSEIYQPLPFNKSLYPLSPREPLTQGNAEQIGAYLRLGLGNYWNTLGDFAMPIVKNDKNRLDLILNHHGTFGIKQHSVSQGNLQFNHFFKSYDLYAGVNLSHEYFNYYGKSYDAFANTIPSLAPPLTNMLWRSNAHVGLRSLSNAKGQKFAGEINYDLLQVHNGVQEHILKAAYGFIRPIGNHRFGTDFMLSNIFYRQNSFQVINSQESYVVLSMNPYYMMERKQWHLRAGVKTVFSFKYGRVFSPVPDISAEWKVLPKYLSIYGGITGSFTSSTLSSIYKENLYVSSDLRVKDVYVPVNPYFGFKMKPLHNLILDAYVDYRFIKDQYFFVNKATGLPNSIVFTNRFDVIYSDANLLRYGARVNYHYKDIVNVQLKGVYNDWRVQSESYAWMKPAIEADLSADVRVNNHLTLSTVMFYEGKRYAQLGDAFFPEEMPSKLDINLSASYAFNRTYSVYAKLNNLLNSKYQAFYGYDVQGINFLVGGAISF